MHPSVEIDLKQNRLLVNGQPFVMLGAEIHYFRLEPEVWEDRIRRAADGGVNTIASYMPWFWHEPAEGRIDLDGHSHPGRNLRRFLDLAAGRGLKLFARPGPFVNAELRLGGMPEWLFRDHPETLSRRSDGAIVPGRPIPAEGEPVYRGFVRRWYDAVVPLLAEYDASRGGPLILFQPDNELSAAWSFGLLNSLYDPTVLTDHWPQWLRERYGNDLSALSASHEIRYGAFGEVAPPRAFPETAGQRRLCLDWTDFKRAFFAEWGATLAGWARTLGIRVPIVFNEPVAGYYGHGDHAGFGAVLKARGVTGFTACHTYSDRILDLDGITGVAMGVELVKSSPLGGPAMSVELNTAWFMSRLARSEINWDTLLRLGLGRGLTGFSVYVYAAATASRSDTIEGPGYYAGTCLTRSGEPSWGWHAVKRFYTFADAWKAELTEAADALSVTLATTPGQRQLDFLGAPWHPADTAKTTGRAAAPGGLAFDAEPVLEQAGKVTGHDWLDGYEGVSKQTTAPETGVWHRTREAMVMLHRLNRGWRMLDLVHPNRDPGGGLLLVPCVGALEAEAIGYLLRHLDDGGACLFFPTLPFYDLEGRPDDRLARRLGVGFDGLVRPAGGRPLDYGTREIACADGLSLGLDGWFWRHAFPAGSEILASFEGQPLAARLPGSGGRVLLAGFDMRYVGDETLMLWESLLECAGAGAAGFRIEGNWLLGLLRRGAAATFLTLANVAGRHGASRISVSLRDGRTVAFEAELLPNAARCLLLDVPLADSNRLLYTSSELTPVGGDRTRFLAAGCPGTAGAIAFDRAVSLVINGRKRTTRRRDGAFVADYVHGSAPAEIVLAAPGSGRGR